MSHDEKNPFLDALQDLLENSGHSPADAHRLALEVVEKQRTLSPGVSFGGIHSEAIGPLWEQAQRTGTRQLVLEITAEGLTSDEYHGHITVKVVGAQTWAEHEREGREAAERALN
ncbi:hypothetical protein [Deinococcus aquaedulcis]|uniref:hypothetical protein n=1 Tax=Deinococcus aquaedulcis TaxID=2840455 RepID=UPI001C82D471|nr:hypothetical protein [Deinococcus aquaedulcis]